MKEIQKLEEEICKEIYDLYQEGKLPLEYDRSWNWYSFHTKDKETKELISISINRKNIIINQPINRWIKSKYAKKIFYEQSEKERLAEDKRFSLILKKLLSNLRSFGVTKD